jgi:hypothetical protein
MRAVSVPDIQSTAQIKTGLPGIPAKPYSTTLIFPQFGRSANSIFIEWIPVNVYVCCFGEGCKRASCTNQNATRSWELTTRSTRWFTRRL